jgi:hypothetical protein
LKGKTMAKIRVDAQRWGEDPDYPQDIEDAGDPRLEQWNEERKREFGPDEAFYNPDNPMAQSYAKMKEAFGEFLGHLQEDVAEFQQDEPEFAARIKEILSQVTPAYKIIQSIDEEVQNVGANYGVGD